MNLTLSRHDTLIDKRNIILFCLLFCYVFAFYLGPFSVSLLIAIPLYALALMKTEYRKTLKYTITCKYIVRILKIWTIVVILGFLYPVLFLTFDYSFVKVILTQALHFIAAFPVLAYLLYKRYSQDEVETQFVNIFLIQTFIQFIVLSSPNLTDFIRQFNRFNPEDLSGTGSDIRGVALSAATTFHLTLAYGIGFIVYTKHYLSEKVSIKNILMGLILFAGIFCAGRSGFVGCAIAILGLVYFQFHKNFATGALSLVRITIDVMLCIILIMTLISIMMPEFYELLDSKILPYAFEAFENADKTGSFETNSTNQLMRMWDKGFNPSELIWGSGNFTDSTGKYYMHVDPGILRHLLFFGILGYSLLVLYQLGVIPFTLMKGRNRFFCLLIFLFIVAIDFKGVSIGGNKFMVFIPLLLSFTYLYLPVQNNIYKHND